MITLFATARPFSGHLELIQNNAIRSWLTLRPRCEILLLGDDGGSAEAARAFGIRHIPKVDCNEFGTPLINSLFALAQRHASNDILCQINADIMLTDDFVPAVLRARANKKKFLIAGQRWDVDIKEPWYFNDSRTSDRLRERVGQVGSLHPPTGLDYFVFVKGTLGEIPPFAIGRRILDNWLIYQARRLGIAVIDATHAITAIHQNHDYSFHPQGEAGVMEGPEVERNLELAGGPSHVFTLEDATHRLTSSGVKPVLTATRLRRHADTLSILYPRIAPVMTTVGRVLKLVKSLRPLSMGLQR
jgi:hypothetical protein